MASVNDDDDSAPSTTLKLSTPLFGSARLGLTIWGLLGFLNMYALRVNLSVALVSMVNSSASHEGDNPSGDSNGTCPFATNESSPSLSPGGEFDWDPQTRSTILASFFYGYIFTQIPGGILAKRFGGKVLFGYGALCTAIFTLLTPLAARTSWKLLVAVRVIEGLGEGVTFPAMNTLFGRWAPPSERSRLSSIAYSGPQLGTILSLPLSAVLCDYVSWDSVFYIHGAVAVLWFFLWMHFAADSPSQSRRISPRERDFIVESLAGEGGSLVPRRTPWADIWRSPRVWAIIVAHTCNNWSFYTLLTETPSYLSDVLHFDIKRNGLVSALPYGFQWIVIIVTGFAADRLRAGLLSTTTVRKFMSFSAFSLICACLLGLAFVECNASIAVALLVGATGFGGLSFSGYSVNHLDIAPEYAGILMGITNCFATIPGFAGPSVVGLFTSPEPTLVGWQKVFFVGAAVSAFGGVTYTLLASGKVQPWASSSLGRRGRGSGSGEDSGESDDEIERRRLLDGRDEIEPS